MTLSTNDGFANRELAIEELDTIAAGGLFGDILHGIEHAGDSALHLIEGPGLRYALDVVKYFEGHPPVYNSTAHKVS